MDDKSKNQEIIVRIICVLLSFGLWLYVSNVENTTKEYKLDKVPVDISNIETLKDYKLALAPNQKFYITLNLEGPQGDIYKINRDQFKIVVDLNSYALRKGENNIPVEIVNAPLNINIKNNGLLKVKIILDDYVEKNMPISTDIKINTKQGIYAQKAQVKPESGMVTGPKEYVDKVKTLSVVGDVKNAEKDVEITLPLVALDDNNKVVEEVNCAPSNATVTIPVNRGKLVAVNIVTKSQLKEGLYVSSMVATPDNIEVIGDDKDLEDIKSIDTEPIDLSKITDTTEVSIALKIPERVKTTLTNNQIKVKINLNKLVTKDFTIPITIKAIDDGLSGKVNPEKIVLTLKGTQEDLDNVKIEDLKAELDLQGKKEGEYTITPTITNPYNNLTMTATDTVKVTITKK